MKAKRRKTSSSTDRTTAYAKAVLAGRIIAGPHVRNACRRHLDDLKRKDIRFDPEAAARALRFFETKLKLSEGQFENEPFKSTPPQDFIIGSIFGWKRRDGTRRFRRAYIEQGKGNGKSPLAGGVGLYGLMADNEAGAEVYSAGATKDQAAVLFRDAVKMVRKSPDLNSRLDMSGGPLREFNIAYLKTASFFRPVSRETKKTGSGPRPHFALVDELHEHPDGGIIEILERGFKFRRQPLLLMITNSGSDRNSVCYAEHLHAVRVAAGSTIASDGDAEYAGEIVDDTTFSYVCALDKDDDPLEDPTCWPKANPLLGVTISQEYLAGVVAQAKALPGKMNGILRLHFCVWTDSVTAWISRKTIETVLADFDPEQETYEEVHAGADLSAFRDLTAEAFCAQTGMTDDGKPTFDAWVEAWTPQETLAQREIEDKAPYSAWIKDGFLQAVPGNTIDYIYPAKKLSDMQQLFRFGRIAYDRYAFLKFEQACVELGLELDFIEHPQGGKRRAKPPEEMVEAAKQADEELPLGLWMPGSLNELETLILEKRIRIRRSPVLISAMMSAAIEKDAFDNRWFRKSKSTQRIDPAVALAMAIGAATMKAPKPLTPTAAAMVA